MTELPYFQGTVVKRISMEQQGLALWIQTGEAVERCYLIEDARSLLASASQGMLRNELTDALRICDTPPGARGPRDR